MFSSGYMSETINTIIFLRKNDHIVEILQGVVYFTKEFIGAIEEGCAV